KSNSRKRRSHNGIKASKPTYCPQCGTASPTHAICPHCGYYQGRTIVDTED
ncbi:MAG: 50S ribosomal protein L32, partial [Gimesia sp.]|nr:50S ribosomal protein L32 [Gimesia sp.]